MNELFLRMMDECQMLDRSTVPGPHGPVIAWTDGAPFRAAIVKDSTMQAREAEKAGVTSVYTITTPPTVPLDFHTVFRRIKDGATFRVTSNPEDSKPPQEASFAFLQVSAERWDVPK